jgi:hypothetical protein
MARLHVLLAAVLVAATPFAGAAPPENPQIDYAAFARDVAEVGAVREARRIPEEEFIRMAREPGTIVLDARSERLFRLRHIAGARNLPFPEFTEQTLAALVPARDTRILIYCNNNFVNLPESMPVKAVSAALNVSTFVSLHAYGYRNVYELGPAIDPAATRLAFEGDEVAPAYPVSGI